MKQYHGLRRAALADFETMRIAVDAGLLHPQRVGVKTLLLPHFANREHRSIKTAHRHVPADLFSGPSLTFVVRVLDHFQLEPGRMDEADVGMSEALLLAAVRNLVPVEVLNPEGNRPLRDGVCRRLNLAGALAARHALVRERRHHRAGLGVRVGVIHVIVRITAVEQNRLFDQPLAYHLGEKVYIFLSSTCTNCDVVDARDGVIHRLQDTMRGLAEAPFTGVQGIQKRASTACVII